MSPPSTRLNTFVRENENIYIDPISRVFILSEAVFGYFRLTLLQSKKNLFLFIAVLYSLCLNAFLFYSTITISEGLRSLMWIQMMQFSVCSTMAFICIKRLQIFYRTLNKFDLAVGFRPRVPQHSVKNLVLMFLTAIMGIVVFLVPHGLGIAVPPTFLLVFTVACTIEVYFYGHLLNLLVPRLKLINFYIEPTLSNTTSKPSSFMKEFVPLKRSSANDKNLCRMRELMDLYYIIVDAYDFLIDAIKWQLLIIILTSFLLILGFLYTLFLEVIRTYVGMFEGFIHLFTPVLVMVPMFSPCAFGDKVHHEVKRLRELLACRLYENKLDKSGRSVARALLAFSETRDLTFRLLHILNIDISLPFKFTALLITYLIILLQFEKVINPGTGAIQNETTSSSPAL